jgi:hypothetical protein
VTRVHSSHMYMVGWTWGGAGLGVGLGFGWGWAWGGARLLVRLGLGWGWAWGGAGLGVVCVATQTLMHGIPNPKRQTAPQPLSTYELLFHFRCVNAFQFACALKVFVAVDR